MLTLIFRSTTIAIMDTTESSEKENSPTASTIVDTTSRYIEIIDGKTKTTRTTSEK